MAEEFLIPIELKGVLMDADWIHRTHGFIARGVAMTNKIKAVKRGTKQVQMNYGAQTKLLGRDLVYKSWPCLLDWDGTLYSNPGTQYRAEVDEDFLCFVLGFYAVMVDKDGQPELDENDKPKITYNYNALTQYMRSLKKLRHYTLVLCYDYELEGDFYKSLELPQPKQM